MILYFIFVPLHCVSVGHGDTVTLAGDAGPGDWSLTTGSDEQWTARSSPVSVSANIRANVGG